MVIPNATKARRDVRVDRALAEHGIAADTQTPWFHLVDRLFAAGDVRNAQRANRFAAPLLVDAIGFLAQSERSARPGGGHRHRSWSLDRLRGAAMDLCAQCLPMLSAPTAVDGDWGAGSLPGCQEIALTRGRVLGLEAKRCVTMLARRLSPSPASCTKTGGDLAAAAPTLSTPAHPWNCAQHKRICLDEMHPLRGARPRP